MTDDSKNNPDPPFESFVPSVEDVADFLLYGLSLPERALRSGSAAVSGAVRQSSSLLIPHAFRSSKSYSMFVEQMLDFMAHDIGGVDRNVETSSGDSENGETENADGEGAQQREATEEYVARKAVGGFIELASLPLLHVSPMTVLAIVSDVAYGSQTYLKELSQELKRQGVIDQKTTIDHAADLLEAIKETTSVAADTIDKPPLSTDGLAETIRQITDASTSADVTKIIPQGEVDRLWNDMQQLATEENQNVFEISGAVSMYAMNRVGKLGQGALSTIAVAGNMFDLHILDHYRQGLDELQDKGFYATLAESSQPYIGAMWENFSSERDTITEDLLSGRMLSRTWKSVSDWFQK